jgi:hypothetical protein
LLVFDFQIFEGEENDERGSGEEEGTEKEEERIHHSGLVEAVDFTLNRD